MTYQIKHLLVVCAYLSFLIFNISHVKAQSDIPELYLCVEPKDDTAPYLIEFWDSIIFGIVIPEDTTITVFSNTEYTAALFSINTSARSGGFLTMEHLVTANTIIQVASGNPCLNSSTRELFSRLPYRTIPLPLSINHALVVQQGKNAVEIMNPFQRVISFSFGIGGEDKLRNLQIIQISDLDPFLNFRYFDLTANIPFIVTANKDFGIGQSLPDTQPPEFSRERPSDIRSFVKSDLQDLYGLDIFELAKEANARTYINSGLLDTYRGTYIRISLAPDLVERIPAIVPDALVRALPDAIASFIAVEQVEGNVFRLNLPFDVNRLGQLQGDSVYRVIEIEESTGQLIIDFDGNPAIVEAWLVEATVQE